MSEKPQAMPDPLDQATHLVKTGRLEEAQAVLVRFLAANPASEQAWLLMSYVVKDLTQQKDCLERVLRINPGNLVARSKLSQVNRVLSGEPLLPPSPAPAPESLIPVDPPPTPVDIRPTIRTGRLPSPPVAKPASIKPSVQPNPAPESPKPSPEPKPALVPPEPVLTPKPAAEPVKKPSSAVSVPPPQKIPPPRTSQKPKDQPKPRDEPAPIISVGMIQPGRPNRRDLLTRLFIILLALVMVGIVFAIGYFLLTGSPSGGDQQTITEVPTPIYKITLPPAWTATNTPTITPTATATPTETPALTNTLSPETGTP